ncbi:MAG: hypothetical protein R3F14_31650 [Polyangiaceae bacterium]
MTPRVGRAARAGGKTQTPVTVVGPAVLPVEKLAIASGLESP